MVGGRRSSFKQGDAAKALKAAVAAGLSPKGYTITPDGAITVDLTPPLSSVGNSFDSILGGGK